MRDRNPVWILALLFVLSGVSLSAQDGGMFDGFEGSNFDDLWWSYDDGSPFACYLDSPGHESEFALVMQFDTGSGSYPGCGVDVGSASQWADSGGLSFFWKSDRPGLTVAIVVNFEDSTQTDPAAEGVTTFFAEVQTTGGTWTQVTLPWNVFEKDDWAGEGGMDSPDPAHVVDLIFEVSERQNGEIWIDDLSLMGDIDNTAESPPAVQSTGGEFDKYSLWTNGTQLRGANIWMRVVVPELDGDEFLGDGRVGPPYTQEDFDRLAALGANYVNISGPGLFTESPPYVLDEEVQATWDELLYRIEQAGMFAVITLRTGPGRSDFTFYRDGAGEWFDEDLLNENVWQDQAAQDAWGEMWRHVAERYRDNPIVVGFDLLCEPNSVVVLPEEIYDPEEFYPRYAGTTYDWNRFYPNIVKAIRDVDSDTPILVSAMGWGAVRWLPYLDTIDDPRIVYMVHQYEPQDAYTHQEPAGNITYPGMLDLDWDGSPDNFDRQWLDDLFSIIDDYKAERSVPVSVNEYGVHRWIAGADVFMRDSMELFEERGMNHSLWAFNPSWPPLSMENDDFDFLHGPDPANHHDVETSDLIEVIEGNWARNTIRPH